MENDKKSNINKTWILIAVLVVLTALLLVISLRTKISTPPEAVKTTENVVEENLAFTTLEISSDPRVSSISGRYELDVILDTDQNEVTNTQLELSYDPNLIRIYDISPGYLIADPQILQKDINSENGRISFWLGTNNNQKWIQGNGTIAIITFSKTGTTGAQINFEAKTSVNAIGTNESVLKDMFSAFIDILPTPSPFPTRVSAPTQPPPQP